MKTPFQKRGGVYVARNSKGEEVFKKKVYPPSRLEQIKPFQTEAGRWVIEVAPNSYLHWIETVDERVVTVTPAHFSMQQFDFREQAEGLCDWLRRRWSDDPDVEGTESSITVKVNVSDQGERKQVDPRDGIESVTLKIE